jgi:hypothetical protein
MEDIQMLVDHRTVMVKRGKMDEVLAFLKTEQARVRQAYNYTGATRNCYVGPFDQLVVESEWNSVAEWDAFWSDWPVSPEGTAFLENWVSLIESGKSELWTLVD